MMAQKKSEMELRAMKEREEVEERYRKQKATVKQQQAALAIQRSYRKNSPKKQSRPQERDRRRRSPRYYSEDETDESDIEFRRRRRGQSRRRVARDDAEYTPRTNGKIRALEEDKRKAEDEAKRAREEMKQLRDEMEQFKSSVTASASAQVEQEKHDKTMATVGMATVRRSNRELKKAYNQLKERVEEQQKLILEIRKTSPSGVAGESVGQPQAAGSEEIRRLKEQMEQMRYEMQSRDMAAEFETQRRREMERNMDEELRMLLMDEAGVFSTGSDGNGNVGSGATGVTPRFGPGIQAISTNNGLTDGLRTERVLRGDISRNGGKALSLDDIIAGQHIPKQQNQSLNPAKTQILRPAGTTMKMAGESLSSKSKFIFPDGNTAPADSAPPQVGLGKSPVQSANGRGTTVPPLNLEPVIPDVRDSTNSLDVTSLYERNLSKIQGLEQLSSNPDDVGSQDQLDQLLVDFLNRKADPYEGRDGRGGGMSAPSGSDSLRAESRYVR
eukprot:g433.t1